MLLDFLSTRLRSAQQSKLQASRQRFVRVTAALDAMSPLKVLSRGYSMVTSENGAIIREARSVSEGQTIHIELCSGSLRAAVTQIQEDAT